LLYPVPVAHTCIFFIYSNSTSYKVAL